MCFNKAESLIQYSFGTRQQRKLFPHFHPPNSLGNKFLPLRGEPHRGPGCYIAENVGLSSPPTCRHPFLGRRATEFVKSGSQRERCPRSLRPAVRNVYELVYNLSRIPTSRKGYAFGARTSVRFKPIKDMTPNPGTYQKVIQEQKHKQNFAPFNTLLPRFKTYSKGTSFPGPGTYNPEIKPPPRITWPMKFGSPDWAQVPCLQKRTLKAELSTDKDFRKHRNRVAYLSLFYD